jgi:hypothetical protein
MLRAAPCEPTGTVPKPSAIAYDAGGPHLAERVMDGDTIQLQWRVHSCPPCRCGHSRDRERGFAGGVRRAGSLRVCALPARRRAGIPFHGSGPGGAGQVRPAFGLRLDRLWCFDQPVHRRARPRTRHQLRHEQHLRGSYGTGQGRRLGLVGPPTIPATKPKCSATIIFFLLIAGNESASVGYGVAGL